MQKTSFFMVQDVDVWGIVVEKKKERTTEEERRN